jgi:hypothetical protein
VSVTSARAYGCSIKYGSFRGGILPKFVRQDWN